MTSLSLKVSVKAAKQQVWALITHPEEYPSFIPDIKEITILQRNKTASLVHWKIAIEEVPLQWTEQCHYNPEKTTVSFRSTRGDFSSYAGTLHIKHSDTGVDLLLDAAIDWDLPSFERVIGKVVEEKVRRSFTAMLLAIKRRVERSRVARTFGFVIHPLDLELISVAFREPNIVTKRRDLISKAFEWLPSFKCSDVVGLKAAGGQEAEGALIYCPLLPDQMASSNTNIPLKRTIEAARAAETLGVKIVGLGAYAAQIGRKGVLVAEAVGVPVTTGTAYTIATAVRATEEACRAVGTSLNHLSVGIIGATGGVGSACTELLARKAGSITLNARNQSRLDALAARLRERSPSLEVQQTPEIDWLIANSDVIITATNTPAALIDARTLRPGTIVCDVSRPRNVLPESVEESQNAVLVFDGGVVKPPGDVDFDFYFGLPPGLAYACMAETMILALAERFEGYSLGGNISAAKVEEISRLGDTLGFRLAELRWCERKIPERTLETVRHHIHKRAVGLWA